MTTSTISLTIAWQWIQLQNLVNISFDPAWRNPNRPSYIVLAYSIRYSDSARQRSVNHWESFYAKRHRKKIRRIARYSYKGLRTTDVSALSGLGLPSYGSRCETFSGDHYAAGGRWKCGSGKCRSRSAAGLVRPNRSVSVRLCLSVCVSADHVIQLKPRPYRPPPRRNSTVELGRVGRRELAIKPRSHRSGWTELNCSALQCVWPSFVLFPALKMLNRMRTTIYHLSDYKFMRSSFVALFSTLFTFILPCLYLCLLSNYVGSFYQWMVNKTSKITTALNIKCLHSPMYYFVVELEPFSV